MSEPCAKDSEIAVLQVRVDHLLSTVSEVKELISRIEESVSIVRVVQVQSDQHTQDYSKLTSIVHELNHTVSELEDKLHGAVHKSGSDLRRHIDSLTETTRGREERWQEKYHMFRGLMLGFALVGGAVSGMSMYLVEDLKVRAEDTFRYVQDLKSLSAVEVIRENPPKSTAIRVVK